MAYLLQEKIKKGPGLWIRAMALGALALSAQQLVLAADDSTVDVGAGLPSAKAIEEGLFPDDACEELKANGFKCMGFKPALKYSLPATAFTVGSAVLPDGLRVQLDRFAQALKGKAGGARTVRIEGHADASGNAASNERLSQRRAEAARDYLVSQGVSADQLKPVGVGARDLVEPGQPLSAKNRRVVIGREQPPAATAIP